ncbi:putative gustatory receptor 28b [Belonocnema kinseyi]|uniref:putative gustatory receptor 28b n=1 Tax=Belonocnema kinseyi TaxID=2817044 RepID=UPI00143DF13B|nr:putative gustatory receptor 28b [Belonocnema kinseyi]
MSTERSDILNNTEQQKNLIILIKHLHMELTEISFQDKRFPQNSRIILAVAGWCGICLYRLLIVNSTCAKVSSKSRRTSEILFQMKNTIQNAELKEEIEQFSLQLIQRPLVFTLCRFISLDYHFVQRFMEGITTYLVLLINFSPEIKR